MNRKFTMIVFAVAAVFGIGAFVFMQQDNGKAAQLAQIAPASGQESTASDSEPVDPWQRRCSEVAGEEEGSVREYCEIYQRLVVAESGQRVVEMAIGFPAEEQPARAMLIVPLGITLVPGVQLQIDELDPVVAPVQRCTQSGCVVSTNVAEDFIQAMRDGETLTVTVLDGSNRAINVELTLNGFAAAIDSVM